MSNPTKKILIGILIILIVLVAGWLVYQNSASADSPRGDKGGAKSQTGALQGKLTWSDGSPVTIGTIYLYQNNSSYPLYSVAVSNGSYQLSNITIGSYDVTARAFNNGVQSVEYRHDVVVSRRQTTTVNFNFLKTLMGSLTGNVKWADSTPVMSGQIEIWNSNNRLEGYNKTYISNGRYTIENVPAGTYDIKATVFDTARQFQIQHSMTVIGGSATVTDFVFKR